ncbi:flippase [Desulfurivibrio alkaliphilus]|uniref:Polysaccharide biosynthesis protein n=1 Tax=Desulfurivibrio alkaliphilus (strain DSM 19089 / UNIQEM U267 / AHT2) TaxID=589865 RepID=D6YZS8_DESAT|nr:flippase [Desulfurivibrio alkaliphilus]ADH85085.1 polysaccharide biosynthesis protein [Desulfurivibrio alkaliphilus AHT 2]
MNKFWTRFLPTFIKRQVEGRAYLQNVVGNTGWQFGDHLVRMTVGLVVGIWLARYLGPEQFGLFSYALALVGLFAALGSLGLDDIMVREIVRRPEARNEILGTSLLLRLFGGAVSLLAALGTVMVLRPDDDLSHWLVGIIAAGALFQAFHVIEFWFHSQVQAKYAVLARNSAFLFCSLLKIGLIVAGAQLIYFAWVALLEVMLGAAGLIIAYTLKSGSLRQWQARLKKAKKLLYDSWPLMLAGLVVMVYLRIDQVMLGEMAGHQEVGIYSVAVRMAEVWLFIPTALYWSVFPAIVEARATSEELFYERLQKFYNLTALTMYAVAVPVALLAHWLVPLLFGADYASGGLLLAVLIWANVFAGLEMARSSFLTVMNWTRIYLVTVTLGCLLNVGLNYWLIPIYGGMGAVIASLAAYWFAAHGSCFLFKPLHRTGGMLTRALFYPKIW